uniref:Ig-like domain-containing protein n=1 Tax=Panagrellus redivivus TaxID=6233 RepID=A0A7E4VDV1_PANRE
MKPPSTAPVPLPDLPFPKTIHAMVILLILLVSYLFNGASAHRHDHHRGSGGVKTDFFVAESPFSQWNDAHPGNGLQEEPARLLHGFPSSGDKTKPKFYPGVWSECSTTCGPGVRSRTVECVAFQGLTSNVIKLPDYECDGEAKPSLFQPCQNHACAADPENLILKASGANPLKSGTHFQWDYGEWSQCSATCLGGRQKSVLKCIDTTRKVSVPWSHCDAKQRPMDLFRECNKGPCPPAWDVGDFGDCSHSCGGGIRTRKVRCIRRVAAAGGAESTLILPDAQCPGDRPNHQEPCGLNDCAPAWRVDQWSSCSVSCGRGEQRRTVVCEQRSATGVVTVYDPPEACASAERPPTVQLCDLGSCDGGGYHSYDIVGSGSLVRPFSDDSMRRSENLIQDDDIDKENFDQGQAAHRKLTLNVGGLANLYEGTSVKVKCPVKNFDRSRIVWTKDGETVHNNAHIKVSTNGALRIFHARMEDAGLYACFANGARGNVTLQFKPRESTPEDANRTRPLETNHIEDAPEPEDLSPTEVDLKLVEKVRLGLQKTGDYRFAQVLQTIRSPGQLRVDYQTGGWSACSAIECGNTDGTQVRLVKCRVALIENGDSAYVEDDVCDAFGAVRPPASKPCKREDCPEWEASDWTDCAESRCVKHHASLQRREVKCVYPNGTHANIDSCNRKTRPKIKKECVNLSCTAEWRPSIWGKCSAKRCATDPSKATSGVQMRLLRCVWRGTKKAAGRHCDPSKRPPAVRACSDGAEMACSSNSDKTQKDLLSDGTCEDKSRFCDIIKVFHSCDQPEIRERCCSSCQTDSKRLRHR